MVHTWHLIKHKRTFIFSKTLIKLLKINLHERLFLAIFQKSAQNKPLFTYFSSTFLKIVLKINVRLSLFRCHVCTVVYMCFLTQCQCSASFKTLRRKRSICNNTWYLPCLLGLHDISGIYWTLDEPLCSVRVILIEMIVLVSTIRWGLKIIICVLHIHSVILSEGLIQLTIFRKDEICNP